MRKVIYNLVGVGVLSALSLLCGHSVKGSAVPPSSVKFSDAIAEAAEAHDLPPALIAAVIHAESNFNPRAVSSAGAKGLMQIDPPTQRHLRLKNVYDPRQNIHAGSRYLRELLNLFGGNLSMALAAYNAGPGAVARHDGIPPFRQTRAYVKKVLAYYRLYRHTLDQNALMS